jgi:diaminopimelate epimerase
VKPGRVFYKMSGSGNDFVMFDGRHLEAAELTPETIVAICDRRLGIGADGVGLLEPAAAGGADPGVTFTFRFWNSDGSPGPMCGNGALCATRLAVRLEFARPDDEVRFATAAGIHRGRVVGERAEIALPDCPMPQPAPDVPTAPGERDPMLVEPSVPHLVLLADDVERVPLQERGPSLRHHPSLGPGGANVNWLSPGSGGAWRMRTFERGVEGETLACGTGAVACALTLAAHGAARSPITIRTTSGLPLEVSFEAKGPRATAIHLRGEARLVYRGIISASLSPTLISD